MKAFFLTLAFMFFLTACSNSGGGGGAAAGSPGEKSNPVEIPAEFKRHVGVNDVTGTTYVPRVTFLLNKPLRLDELPAGRGVALIFNDPSPGAHAELSLLTGQLSGEKYYEQKIDSENRIEKLNANTWRIILSRTMLNAMVNESRASSKFVLLTYSIPNSEIAKVFAVTAGLKPSYDTQEEMVRVGHVVIPVVTEVQAAFAAKQVESERYVREKLQDLPGRERVILGMNTLKIDGRKTEVNAKIKVLNGANCTIDYSLAQEVVSMGNVTGMLLNLKSRRESPCSVVGDYLVLEGIGRVSLTPGSGNDGTTTHGVYLSRTLFTGETAGLLTHIKEGQDIYLRGMIGSSN